MCFSIGPCQMQEFKVKNEQDFQDIQDVLRANSRYLSIKSPTPAPWEYSPLTLTLSA